MSEEPTYLLEISRLRVQNANTISSPMTWGFPAMSAFVGLMHALERKLDNRGIELFIDAVGVICHRHEPQISTETFPHTFRLTRNPVAKDGSTAAIVEEGRIHLDISLIFSVRGNACADPDSTARHVEEIIQTLRIAGGTVQPALPGTRRQRSTRLIPVDENPDERAKQYRKLLRSWLPGFTLVARDDLLHERWDELRKKDEKTTLLDAWLDLSRLNMECHAGEETSNDDSTSEPKVKWEARRPPGWIVPIPVGYGALTPLHDPGSVSAARDASTPFRFVESLYSIGEWRSPHRLDSPRQLMWFPVTDPDQGRYRLQNEFVTFNPNT